MKEAERENGSLDLRLGLHVSGGEPDMWSVTAARHCELYQDAGLNPGACNVGITSGLPTTVPNDCQHYIFL